VEVSELRDIILSATERSLVLGDEVCSGTESMSATALVASTLEHLDSVGTHFMFDTHLHDLMKVGFLPRPGIAVWHLRVQNIGGKLIYDRTLQPGSGSCTYGLEVARAMGIPLTLIDRAHEIRRILSGETANGAKSTWNSEILRKSCEMCGSPILKDLEVHHITPRSEGGNNRLRNLIVLCEGCHDKEHSGGPTVGELQMTSEGLTRTVSETSMKSTKVKTKWNEEEMESIRATIKQFEGRPITRVVLALDEKGIKITPGQLRSLSQGV
jgi:DNA mismatch repair protein MutS